MSEEQREKWRAALEALLPCLDFCYDEGSEEYPYKSSEMYAGINAIEEILATDFGARERAGHD